jgi:uncharacterized small protein (TIGR04563 family)
MFDSSRDVGESAKKDLSEQKTSVYFKGTTLSDIKREAARLDRGVGWVLARAWAIAKEEIARLPDAS